MAPLRRPVWIIALLCAFLPLGGATLEKLSLADMIGKSTAIIRARVGDVQTARRGNLIYSFSSVEVLEQWKGSLSATMKVAVPGGVYGGYSQEFSGAPALQPGSEYVLFLWTGTSGLNQVIGLSQGVFTLRKNEAGEMIAHRAASGETVLDPKTGQPVEDKALTLLLGELRDRVQSALGATSK
jgi:hypothetical protein